MTDDELMTTGGVARWLSVSESTIRKWVHYGFIPHVKLGRAVRFSRTDIEKWIRERAERGRATRVPHIRLQ